MKRQLLFSILFACCASVYAQADGAAANLFNAATTTMSSWFTGVDNWNGENQSRATWDRNTGTVTVHINQDKNAQWKAQIKLNTTGIVLDASRLYRFTCNMNTNNAIGNVTVKVFDDSALSMRSAHVIQPGDNTVSNGTFMGGSIGNGIIVFDFGYAKSGDVITISNIMLTETEPDPIPEPGADGYSLVWNEEFTDGSFDLNNWNIETTANPANNELQYYSDRGVSVERDPVEGKHCLVLTARKESLGGRQCTSGRVTTENKTTFLYGKIEARIWFPNTGNGLWPAFWMMGNDIGQVGWPACGETDIVELGNNGGYNGRQDRFFNGASHWGPRWDQHYQAANSITNDFSVEDGFHIWTCIWDSTHVAMYVDKDTRNTQPYYEMAILPSSNSRDPGYYFHKRNFILLNLAIGGDFTGIHNVNQITALADGPRAMYIDWVRVYQKENAANLISGSGSDEVEEIDPEWHANAVDDITLESEVTKCIIDGQIFIRRNGKLFTIQGQEIR
ncbi:MAG: glycoside hydrolase family 16 protein [Paludibacteraceae bacterium]|nr:glycoside hydrolase family 16 protein [Paludibacteraceae bacterium]